MPININFLNKINLTNCLICLLPLSMIIGSLAININTVLICLAGLITYKFEIFKMEKKIYQYLLYCFFLYLIIITIIKFFPTFPKSENILYCGSYLNIICEEIYKENIFKSFSFLRFLLLFLVVNKLLEKDDLNLNFFFISCAFLVAALSIDILVQIIFGKDLLGNPITNFRPSGFFGDEKIAGSYIQKFSLFFIFFSLFKYPNNKIYFWSLLIFFFIVLILVSNRMPTLIYFFSFILFFLMERKFKEIFILIFVVVTLIFGILKYDKENGTAASLLLPGKISYLIKNFYYSSSEVILNVPELFWHNKLKNQEINHLGNEIYLVQFNSGAQVWKQNKIFGGGLKSFRLNCKFGKYEICNTHPHNYVLEILVDTGLLGLIIIYSIFIISIFNFFKFYIQNFNSNAKFLAYPFFLIVFFELFPIRSTGSFFTTSNAVIFFLMFAFLINASKLNLSEQLKK